MQTVSDALVVGGGPCGSFAALNLARLGADVTVHEEHREIGVPCHCAGHLSITGLKRLGLYPLPRDVIENSFQGAIFHSPFGREFQVRFPTPTTCAVNRALFDKFIAEKAEKAGAHYSLGSRVRSLIVEDGFVKGAVAIQNGGLKRSAGRIVIDAEGISSRLSRQAGLPAPNRLYLFNGVDAEIDNVKDVQSDMVEVFLGRNYAPHFFAWLIPKGNGQAKVGLAAKNENAKRLLQKLMQKHPVMSGKLHASRVLQTTFHPVTLGGPIARTYSNGLLAVGDVASHVKPTTGGGVILGLTCSRIAAEVANEALHMGNVSKSFLSSYQKRCKGVLGFDMRAMLRIRKMLDALSDKQLDDAIGFCQMVGLNKALEDVEDIDFQGRSLLSLVRSPPMLAVLAYFFLSFCKTLDINDRRRSPHDLL
jgi:digeranylgeranylglycerophospholipid reductase